MSQPSHDTRVVRIVKLIDPLFGETVTADKYNRSIIEEHADLEHDRRNDLALGFNPVWVEPS